MTETGTLVPAGPQATLAEKVSCVWVFRLRPSWRLLDREARRTGTEALMRAFEKSEVEVRGTYSLAGFRADADIMTWCISDSPEALNDLAVALRRTALGQHLEPVEVLMGLAGPSEYNPDHLPAFLKGTPPRRYLSVYPFVKSPAWYLLPAEERGALMAEHGRAGREHAVAANTVRAFGLGDAEFVVALESETLKALVDCMDALRRSRVREYTARDAPIYLGRLQPLGEVLAGLG